MGDGVDPREVLLTSDNIEGTFANGSGGRRIKGRLAGGVRDKLTMAEMKVRMAALWKDGETYVEIADTVSDEFGLEGDERFKANTIHYHIKTQLEYWRTQGLKHIDEKQAMVLARYDQIEMICMEAYFASLAGSTTSRYEKQVVRAKSADREKALLEQIQAERANRRDTKQGKFTFEDEFGELGDMLVATEEKIKEHTSHTPNAAGDPKWVALMIDINDKRAKLWGLLSKKGPDSDDAERAKLSDEQRDERLAAVLSAALHRRTQEAGETNLAPPAPLGGFDEEDVPKEAEPVEVEVLGPEIGDDDGFDFSDDEDVEELWT